MTSARFAPSGPLRGSLRPPADKSVSHRAALIAAGREERIERTAPDIERHAAAIVGKNYLDIVLVGLPYLDVD